LSLFAHITSIPLNCIKNNTSKTYATSPPAQYHSSVLRTLTKARDGWINFPTARLISDAHWAKLDPAIPADPR